MCAACAEADRAEYARHERYVVVAQINVAELASVVKRGHHVESEDIRLALLDARVGLDGARNRSDVVRLAIQEFLHNQPKLTGMKSVRIPLGRHDQAQLGKLYELQGVTPELAAQEGLKLYIERATAKMQAVAGTLDSAVEASRAETLPHSEYQQ